MRSRFDASLRDKVQQVDLKRHGITDYGELSILAPMIELFSGGKRLSLARYPNQGWMHIGQVVEVGQLRLDPRPFLRAAAALLGGLGELEEVRRVRVLGVALPSALDETFGGEIAQ